MTSIIMRSFAAGELSPALAGRADQTKYQTGLKTCRNFFVMRHGGVSNRPGTGFIAEQKVSNFRGRLMKFVYDAEQTYILLFEHETMRVFQGGAQVVVSGVAAYDAGTTYGLGALVSSAGINYYSRSAGNIGNTPATNPGLWHALTGVIYEIPTPYDTADLPRLQRDQSGDVLTITHPSYPIMELRRTGNTAWTLVAVTLGPTQPAPTAPMNTGGGAGSAASWVVTAINSETFEESLPTAATTSAVAPTSGSPITVNWTDASGAGEYNIYRAANGINGFVGVAASGVAGFIDNGSITPDTTETPPQARNPFGSSGNYPSTSGYWQRRHIFADTTNAPEKAWTSKSASFKNFSISSPLQDDDAVTFTVSGNEVQEIRHILSLGQLIILTAGGEWKVQGDANGVLTPLAINPVQDGYNGASWVKPAIVGNTAIYVQARGSIVRDLRYTLADNGYSGKDLSVYSAHLFEGYTIGNGSAGMDYQQIPHSIVWCVRSDGRLLGLTYLREHEIWGWHQHDTDGIFEDVCCVPEGEEDAVYVLVRRTIGGAIKRFVERFYSRRVTDVAVDARFVDCGLTYDGRNLTVGTVELSGGVGWLHTETLTLTGSAGYFVPGDVGNAVVLWTDVTTGSGEDAETVRHKITFTITGYTSSQIVSGRANMTVPPVLRDVALATWGRAVDDITGLGHLEGKTISIIGDGDVISNGVDEPLYTVSGGAIHLSRPYMVVHAGLPFTSDFETLDLEVLGGETISDKQKLIKGVTLIVQESRGIFAGPDFEDHDEWGDNLVEYKQRENEDWGEPTALFTGKVDINTVATWDTGGRVCVRQRDPLPLALLAAIPRGEVGG